MIAIISVTKQGDEVLLKLKEYLSCETFSKYIDEDFSFKACVKDIFRSEKYDGVIFISSTGIAVRAIAPYIESKLKDPAVVVVDCYGKFSISLLSGHLGGGNILSTKVSKILDSINVVTTATDIKNVVAPDIVAKENNLIIDDFKVAKDFAVKLLDEKSIGFLDDFKTINIPKGYSGFKDNLKDVLWITNKVQKDSLKGKNILKLIKKNIVLGIGCKKDTDEEHLVSKVLECLDENNIDKRSVLAIGSIDIKKDEKAMLKLKEVLNCDFKVFTKEDMLPIENQFEISHFVKKTVGVGSVCEPSVKLLGGEIILEKQKLGGVTLCIGEVK
ncbi:MAG: cobalt-precorrin 5A hydrolase [Clostridium perfringens]|nr:cobalt-precorrin 5A hydrolase [Clostridium perfringens]